MIWLALYPKVAEAASVKAILRLSFLRPVSSVDVDKIIIAVIYSKKKKLIHLNPHSPSRTTPP